MNTIWIIHNLHEETRFRRLISLWSNLKLTFIFIVLTTFLIVVISNLNGSFALPFVNYTGQYTNYTNNEYQIQFQYPSNWCIFEEDKSLEIPSMSIHDQSRVGGLIRIWFQPLSDYLDLVPNTSLDDVTDDVSDSIVRKVTEHEFPFKNDSDTRYYLLGKPSYLSIDGHLAGTDSHIQEEMKHGFWAKNTEQVWNVLVGERYYFMYFVSDTDDFDSQDFMEIRDKFINSIKFLTGGNVTSTGSGTTCP